MVCALFVAGVTLEGVMLIWKFPLPKGSIDRQPSKHRDPAWLANCWG